MKENESELSIIEKLSEYDAFEHTTIPIYEIPHLFTPFESVTNKKTERILNKAVRNGECISLKAETGAGKTCVSNFVFLTLQPEFFPIILSPFLEDVNQVCSSPEEFTRFVLTQTFNNVQNFSGVDKKAKELAQKAMALKISYVEGKKMGIGVKIKSILSFIPFLVRVEPELAVDLEKYTQKTLESKVYNTQRIACIRQLCETVEAYNTKPVFLIDDTDKFLKRTDLDLSGLAPPFFGKILPSILKIEHPVIVATHKYYDRFSTYQAAERNCFNRVITIPQIEYDGMKQVIAKRINAVEKAKLGKVFDEDALKSIFHYYRREPILRRVMLLCRECIEKASSEGLEKITSPLVTSIILGSERYISP